MPLKCTKCGKVAQTRQECICECDADHFAECPTIHLLHPKGLGPAYSSGQSISVGDENTPKTKKSIPLHIGCNKRNGIEQCTVLKSLVSCGECLKFLENIQSGISTDISNEEPKPL